MKRDGRVVLDGGGMTSYFKSTPSRGAPTQNEVDTLDLFRRLVTESLDPWERINSTSLRSFVTSIHPKAWFPRCDRRCGSGRRSRRSGMSFPGVVLDHVPGTLGEHGMFPVPYSLSPVPLRIPPPQKKICDNLTSGGPAGRLVTCSLFPVPCSLFPQDPTERTCVPCSLFPYSSRENPSIKKMRLE